MAGEDFAFISGATVSKNMDTSFMAERWALYSRSTCCYRNARYTYYPDVARTVGELCIGVAYGF